MWLPERFFTCYRCGPRFRYLVSIRFALNPSRTQPDGFYLGLPYDKGAKFETWATIY